MLKKNEEAKKMTRVLMNDFGQAKMRLKEKM